MGNILSERRILLGVTGSIACYKAADLASKLTQQGASVTAILTAAARQFITPLTFQSVTGQRAYVDEDLWGHEGHIQHLGLAHGADLIAIAPASANTIAKIAHGICDNLLTLTCLAATCPILIAPAMDSGMYTHPTTQANVEILKQRGVYVAGPATGRMASGLTGIGRMLEPSEILGHLRWVLGRQEGRLKGKRLVVTAGGTSEPIDAVRVITNRSSGKQGFAIAQAAIDQGAEVTLITGPTALPTPVGARRIEVNTAQEMLTAVLEAISAADALVMAAAVADFRPETVVTEKLSKEEGIPQLRLTLAPDILSAVAHFRSRSGYPRVVIGFAAESGDLVERARQKLVRKRLDLIVANDITAPDSGLGADTNRVTLIDPAGNVQSYPLMTKDEVAQILIEKLVSLLEISS
ncbi:MAG: bifunctional phosphopantothenoylcysteine decarboxylase/phosphopantothenate--cysteine ligase CoaBC [Anaerolineales bacterium]|nr:bifunctional phosphopantothenoylcysteine decarboxylase/phosphopantothenate--cysteine ligase CoaBC [Anaerolineales bacterium]MDW8160455.1 bifunctional phosphopantothenoylcysteine decarboxylase/phosphopantothenate--cysteine ligase CoaBC [Anaerolineales bacterium]